MILLKKIDEYTGWILKVLLILSVLIMTVILALGVFYRLLFDKNITMSAEVCNYCILLITFGGASYAARLDKQVKISYLFDAAPWHAKKIWAMIINLGMSALTGYMTYYAFTYALTIMHLGKMTQVLGLPACLGIFIVAAGFLLLAVEYFIEFILTCVSKDKIFIGRNPIIKEEA